MDDFLPNRRKIKTRVRVKVKSTGKSEREPQKENRARVREMVNLVGWCLGIVLLAVFLYFALQLMTPAPSTRPIPNL
jgi:hypothetical protein